MPGYRSGKTAKFLFFLTTGTSTRQNKPFIPPAGSQYLS
jgi:hypothetical protein